MLSDTIFQPPYDGLTPKQLLEHFQGRSNVHYFPVPSAEETRRDRIDAVLENRMELNEETHMLTDPPAWLINPSIDREWHISLHKFYYATGLGLAFWETGDDRYTKKWVSLTSSWIEQTPPRFINSQVAGRRIQNWIYAYYYFVTSGKTDQVPADFHLTFLSSLHQQVEELSVNLDAARNHRTLELYAIFLAAVVFPEYQKAQKWLDFSLHEILENMRNDLLPDGVHCELSTDYHHTVLKNLLCVHRLAKLNDITLPKEMNQLIQKALDFSLFIHKPDGYIPSLSDGDVGSYLELLDQGHELFDRDDLAYVASRGNQGSPPKERSKGFPESGYYIIRSSWDAPRERFEDARYLVFDCGPLGAGDHGHFDLLNIELAAWGRSLVVDPGRYTYCQTDTINWRALFRGTAYHNTVVVDGKNQTRYLPGKKKYEIKGLPPEPEMRAFSSNAVSDYLYGMAKSHEYDAVHERRIFFAWSDYFIVSDSLVASGTHRYDLLFHLSPDAKNRVNVERTRKTWMIDTPNLLVAQPEDPGLSAHVDDGFVSHTYGSKQPAPVLRFSSQAQNTVFHTVLYPYKEKAPTITLGKLTVHTEATATEDEGAFAFRIDLDYGTTKFTDYCFFAPHDSKRWRRFGKYRYSGNNLLLRTTAGGRITLKHLSKGSQLEELEQSETEVCSNDSNS